MRVLFFRLFSFLHQRVNRFSHCSLFEARFKRLKYLSKSYLLSGLVQSEHIGICFHFICWFSVFSYRATRAFRLTLANRQPAKFLSTFAAIARKMDNDFTKISRMEGCSSCLHILSATSKLHLSLLFVLCFFFRWANKNARVYLIKFNLIEDLVEIIINSYAHAHISSLHCIAIG